MTERFNRKLLVAAVLLTAGVLALPACSSDDDGGDAANDTTASNDTTADDSDKGDDSGEGDEEATSEMDCTKVLTLPEVEELFGEPAVLEDRDAATNNEQVGQVTCTWSTVEDEANTEDLASQSLMLQRYTGGGSTSGKNFYDPEVQFPNAEPLDIGDEGVIDTEGGFDIAFLEGDTSVFLSWITFDLSGAEPDRAAKKDTMIDLARTVHDRAF